MGRPALRRPHIGHGHRRAEPVAFVCTRQFAANSCHSLWGLRAAFGLSQDPVLRLSAEARRCGMSRGEGGNGTVRHAPKRRVLAGFWREKAARIACHPSYRGAPLRKCSKGVFRALSPWREGVRGATPLDPTRLRRPFPSFLHHRRGRAAHPAPRSAQPFGVTSITFFDRPRDLGPPSHGTRASDASVCPALRVIAPA
jgi:hypothetical protein